MAGPRAVTLHINGQTRRVRVDPRRKLLDVLRNELRLTGAKYGCGEGQCGACTVLVDGEPTKSCLRAVARVEGREITTIEGLARGDELHPVQQAFIDEGAMQCGYCTPGMILAAVGLLRRTPKPTQAEIVEGMRGNLCRCGTQPRIVRAIGRASR